MILINHRFYLTLFIAVLLIGPTLATAKLPSFLSFNKKPEWMDPDVRKVKYPDDQYFSVFREVPCNNKKSRPATEKDLSKMMRIDLTKSYFKESDDLEILSGNANAGTAATNTSSPYFKKATKIPGIEENYYYSPRKKRLYGFVYIQKRKLIDSFYELVLTQITEAQNSVAKADENDLTTGANASANLKKIYDQKEEIDDYKEVLNEIVEDENTYEKKQKLLDLQYKDFVSQFENLSARVRKNFDFTEGMIIDANVLFQKNKFTDALAKYNEILIYDPGNTIALDKKNECIKKIIEIYQTDIDNFEAKGNFYNAAESIRSLCEIDPEIGKKYVAKFKELAQKYFDEGAKELEFYLENKNLQQASTLLNRLEPYSKLDKQNTDELMALRKRLEALRVEIEIDEVNSLAYEKKYYEAFSQVSRLQQDYPYNDKVIETSNEIFWEVYSQKKKDFKSQRPTEYVIEPGFSLSSSPRNFVNSQSSTVQLDSKEMFSNLYSYYELGLYRKYDMGNVKDSTTGKIKRFKYSQIGLKFGLLNPNTGIFRNDSTLAINSYLFDMSASVLLRKFMMFNVGITSAASDLSNIKPFYKPFYSTTLGFRLPIGPLHLTTALGAFSDFDKTYDLMIRWGASMNIGLIKKYTSKDKKYIRSEVEKLKP